MSPQEMMVDAAALLNDQIQSVFTDAVLLPYYNMSTQKLQEVFEANNLPVTNVTSISLNVPTGTTRIAFQGTIPLLPSDLIDIRELWESDEGQNNWLMMERTDFLPHYLENNQPINQFGLYAWNSQEIKVIAANTDIDIKLDYIKSIFPRITISQIIESIAIPNVSGFLTNWMAGLASFFIGENESRATILYSLAEESLQRAVGISVKGQQSISTRRRPYRQSYKSRQVW